MTLVSDRALSRRIERADALNTVDYVQTMVWLFPGGEAAMLPVGGGYAVFTGAAFPINRAVGLGMETAVTAEEMAQLEGFYHSRGLAAEIEVCPLADPLLIALVGARGYRLQTFFNVYARPILPADASYSLPPDLRIEPLANGEQWAEIVVRNFGGAADNADSPGLRLARTAFHRPGVTGFVAWSGSQAVGSAALAIREGVAALFSTSTHPEFRRHGVHAGLIAARLSYALAAGCDMAMVTTVPGSDSQRNMQRAGFEVLYTRPVLSLERLG